MRIILRRAWKAVDWLEQKLTRQNHTLAMITNPRSSSICLGAFPAPIPDLANLKNAVWHPNSNASLTACPANNHPYSFQPVIRIVAWIASTRVVVLNSVSCEIRRTWYHRPIWASDLVPPPSRMRAPTKHMALMLNGDRRRSLTQREEGGRQHAAFERLREKERDGEEQGGTDSSKVSLSGS